MAVMIAVQPTFEQATRDLASPDRELRLRAVRAVREAAYPEATLLVAPLLADPDDDVQREAIAAQASIFVPLRGALSGGGARLPSPRTASASGPETAFLSGPTARLPGPVPPEVLAGLIGALDDENPAVALDALYAFGALAPDAADASRATILRTSAPMLAARLTAPDPVVRLAAVRVAGRVFAHRPGDPRVDEAMGDAVIAAMNDQGRGIRRAAMEALGSMRYGRAMSALAELSAFYGSDELGQASLDALARIAHPSTAETFMPALSGRSAPLKRIAIEGLARIGGRSSDVLTALTGEKNEPVLLAGSFASVLAGGPAEEIVDALGNSRLRSQALGYLYEAVPGRAALFTRISRHTEPQVRADVAEALGFSRDPAATPVLDALAGDPDRGVLLAVERATQRLKIELRRR